ncbi:MAG: NAD(P)H-binding protein [Streptosporangiaceae bacterium]|nr:NAD(P)H-binding protein [Streptosporangiaceae bacterium]
MTQLDVVTGAFSYSGAAIARQLGEEGHLVRTLTGHPQRATGYARGVRGDGISPVKDVRPLDFAGPGELEHSLTGAHTLYNTYWVRFSRGTTSHAQAVANSRILFDAAKRAGVQRIVHVSITHADPRSPHPYFQGKGEVEEYLKSTGVPYAILRPAILFGGDGVLLNNIAWLLRHVPVFAIGGRGDYRIRPIHIDDLARLAVAQGASTENVTMDAVGPESLRFRDMVAAIRRATHSRAVIVHVPGRLVAPLSAVLGVLLRDVLLTPEEFDSMAEGLADSDAPATGQISLTEWLSRHGEELGRRYANELDRHFR